MSNAVRIYLAVGVTDLRKGIKGLSTLTGSLLNQDPASGHFFVFCNRAKTTIKILFYESGGYWLVQKRLSCGSFSWPQRGETQSLVLSQAELWAILGGLDFEKASKRKWYDPKQESVKINQEKSTQLEGLLRTKLHEAKAGKWEREQL